MSRNICDEDNLFPNISVQIEFLEMRVEAAMIHRRFGTAENSKSALSAEWIAWKRLFGKNYRDRTMVGILIAFFQRMFQHRSLLEPILIPILYSDRMERNQCSPILWPYIGQKYWTVRRKCNAVGIRRNRHRAILSRVTCDCVHWQMGCVVVFCSFSSLIPFHIPYLGRRPLLRGGSVAMTCSHFSISILVKFCLKMSTSRYALSRSFTQIILFASDWAAHSTAAWIGVGFANALWRFDYCIVSQFSTRFVYTFTAAYGMSFGPVAWVLPSEVFPLSMRSKGVALSTASVWVNNCKSLSSILVWFEICLNSLTWFYSPHRLDHSRHIRMVSSVSLFETISEFS